MLVGRERQIGAIGTFSRVAGGAVALALPIGLAGFTWWDALVALLALPVIALLAAPLVTVTYQRLAPQALQSRHGICSAPGCSLIVVMVAANAALAALTHANGNVTLWVWLGASMVLAAARGYAGCEVLAISNVLTGRSDQISCILYTPIDRWEANSTARKTKGPAAAPQ